jgi:hypothetical protein
VALGFRDFFFSAWLARFFSSWFKTKEIRDPLSCFSSCSEELRASLMEQGILTLTQTFSLVVSFNHDHYGGVVAKLKRKTTALQCFAHCCFKGYYAPTALGFFFVTT